MTESVTTPVPQATKKAHTHTTHADSRPDPYHWLKERENPEVTQYLEAENNWCDANMAHLKELEDDLFDDMKRRIKEDDESLPWYKEGYSYFWRSIQDAEYQEFWRVNGRIDDPTTIDTSNGECLLDCNALAKGTAYFDLGAVAISPNQRWMAYGVDTSGDEYYDISFVDLTTNQPLDAGIKDVYASFTFAADNETFFYLTLDATHRPYQVWRLTLGDDASRASLVFDEPDEAFFVGISRTLSDAWLMIDVHSKVTSEVHLLNAKQPLGDWHCVKPRRNEVEYEIDHHSDRFFMLSNENATNFKLLASADCNLETLQFDPYIDERDDTTIVGFDVFHDHLIVFERRDALEQVRVEQLSSGECHYIDFEDDIYEVNSATNVDFNSDIYQFGYSSLTTPYSTYDYDLITRERTLRKRQDVLGGFDSNNYVAERLWIPARDNTRVPVSLVYHRDFSPQEQSRPMLLTGYGSYGSSYPAYFSSGRLTLLDRGCTFAVAHVRGGQEMGRRWYEAGKYKHKKNTFNDFIDCAAGLQKKGYSSSEQMAIMGGSAGGLLMGAVVNDRPDLFCAVLAQVPFVDVLTTMLDLSLPLTMIELEEWGDPRQRDYYDYMKSYSPYDNVKHQHYPAMLVTAGLNDPRVSYWEPAKWTARLREHIDDPSQLLLKTNMDAGHAGASGRYGYLREVAFEYAFVLDQLGLSDTRLATANKQ